MLIGKMGQFSIYRTGETIEDGGSGITWRCTCPRGEPVEYIDSKGRRRKRRCRHIREIWKLAKEDKLPKNLILTPEGAKAAVECLCRLAARRAHAEALGVSEEELAERAFVALQAQPTAPIPPTAPGDRKGPAKGGPCPCGSGHKYKKCEGPDDGSAPHARFAFDDLPGFSVEDQERLKEERRQKSLRDDEERLSEAEAEAEEAEEWARLARLERAERKAEAAERKVIHDAALDVILERVHAADDVRKAKKAAYDAGRRVQRAAYDKARRAAKKAASANG